MGNNTSHSHNYSQGIQAGTARTGSSGGGGGASSSGDGRAGPSTGSNGSPPSPPSGPPVPPPDSTFVDGGYLLPLSNIYPASPQDWLHPIVQRLILSRKLAPFYRGLEDWEEAWQSGEVRGALEESRGTRMEAVSKLEEKEREEKEEAEKVGAGRKAGKSREGQTMDARGKKEAARAVGWEVRDREVERYIGATAECPLCFLYYPSNINMSRCCQQPICTECFVQIKRTDPTPQELKSEPVSCPYCVESNFGVTYEPPHPGRRTDWEAPTAIPIIDAPSMPSPNVDAGTPTTPDANASAISATSIGSPTSFAEKSRRRKSTSHMSSEVVTTDAIQQDWRAKLEAVKAAVQRRANRRIIFRQEGDRLVPVGVTSSRDPMGHAFLSALGARRGEGGSGGEGEQGGGGQNGEGNGSRRGRRHRDPNYGVDLEELMVMEAMRLSLMEEEERQKKEKAEHEKKEKEAKQAEKERLKEEEKRLKEEKKAHKGKGHHSGTSTPTGSTSASPIAGSSAAAASSNRPRSGSAVRELFHRHHHNASSASSPPAPISIPPTETAGETDLERQISEAMGGSNSPPLRANQHSISPPSPLGLGVAHSAADTSNKESAASEHSSLNRLGDSSDARKDSSSRSVASSEGASFTRQSTGAFSMGEYQPLGDDEDDAVTTNGGRERSPSGVGIRGTAAAAEGKGLSLDEVKAAVQVPQRGSSVPPSD